MTPYKEWVVKDWIVFDTTFYGKRCSGCGFQIYHSNWACRSVTILNCQHWLHTLCFNIIYQANRPKMDNEQAFTCSSPGCRKKTALKGIIKDLPSKNLLVENPKDFSRYLVTYFSTEEEMKNYLIQSGFKAIFFDNQKQNEKVIDLQAQMLEKHAFFPMLSELTFNLYIKELTLNFFNQECALLVDALTNARESSPFHQLVTVGDFQGAWNVIAKTTNIREVVGFSAKLFSLLEKNNYINLLKFLKEMSLSSQSFWLDYLLLKKKAKEETFNSNLCKFYFDMKLLWQFEG